MSGLIPYRQLTFQTSFFQPLSGEDEETNPGRHGKALAQWLFAGLKSQGVEVESVLPEDFGWAIIVFRNPYLLWIGCGNTEGSTTEWSIFIEVKTSLMQRIFRRIDPALEVENLKECLFNLIVMSLGCLALRGNSLEETFWVPFQEAYLARPWFSAARINNLLKRWVSLFVLLPVPLGVFADSTVWQELRRGGHVILMRHASTDGYTASIDPESDFDGCATHRNLSLQGRADASRIGQSLRAQRIPVAEVLAGPACRTQDTARLAFKKYKVWDALDVLTDFSEEDAAQRTALVSDKIRRYRGRKNWVFITHQPNIDALIFDLVEPGTLVILRPDGKNFKVVGKLNPNARTSSR